MLSAKDISVSFDGDNPVLDGLSLNLEKNEIVALLGPSGCGKSTVLRALAGLQPINSGTIKGFEAGKFGFVFQDAALMPWATVFENVTLPSKLTRSLDEAKLTSAIEDVGLTGFENRYPLQLSGGQRMRVSVARALSITPSILLLDEPFAALDEILRFQMNDLLLRLCEERSLSVLFVTHSLFEAAYLADRILVMGQGHLVGEVKPLLDRTQTAAQQRASKEFSTAVEILSSLLSEAS